MLAPIFLLAAGSMRQCYLLHDRCEIGVAGQARIDSKVLTLIAEAGCLFNNLYPENIALMFAISVNALMVAFWRLQESF